MVKVRAAASPGPRHTAPVSRKRAHEDVDHEQGSSKRRLDPDECRGYTREVSPSKNVHFGRNLIRGPTPSGHTGRSVSPQRPALHKRFEPSGGEASPSAQLHAEYTAANRKTLAQKAKSPASHKKTTGSTKTTKTTSLYDQDILAKAKAIESVYRDSTFLPKQKQTPELDFVNSMNDETNQMLEHGFPDIMLCSFFTGVGGLAERIVAFAKNFPSELKCEENEAIDEILVPGNEQLIRYIGCLAQGGSTNVAGWRELLSDATCRNALVIGIVGRAVKEHVFDDLYFGATTDLRERLEQLEQKQIHQDGFARARDRAAEINRDEKLTKRQNPNTAAVWLSVATLVKELEVMLLPLWKQGKKQGVKAFTTATWYEGGYEGMRGQLVHIVSRAGAIGRAMRRSGEVVYYSPPTFKDEEFDPGRMECRNLREMIATSPYDRETVKGHDRAILREGSQEKSQAIVRVVCFPGIVAYRQGGGDLARDEMEVEAARRSREHASLPADVKDHKRRLASQDKPLTGQEGFRTCTIAKSVVLLQWGKQRALTKEAGTSVHLDAMKGKNGRDMKRYDDGANYAELWKIFERVLEGVSINEQEYEWSRKHGTEGSGFFGSWPF